MFVCWKYLRTHFLFWINHTYTHTNERTTHTHTYTHKTVREFSAILFRQHFFFFNFIYIWIVQLFFWVFVYTKYRRNKVMKNEKKKKKIIIVDGTRCESTTNIERIGAYNFENFEFSFSAVSDGSFSSSRKIMFHTFLFFNNGGLCYSFVRMCMYNVRSCECFTCLCVCAAMRWVYTTWIEVQLE